MSDNVSPPPAGESSDLTKLAEGMAEVADVLKTLAAAATGYRRYLIEQGWPEVQADALAGQALAVFQHRLLVGHQ